MVTAAGATQTRIEFEVALSAGARTTVYIDTAKALSCVNHRRYRQGNLYYTNVEIVPTAVTSNGYNYTVTRLPDTWMIRKAWKEGFDHWNKHVKKAMGGTKRARWQDFRIAYEEAAIAAGTLVPTTAAASGVSGLGAGEHDLSEVYNQLSSTNFMFQMLDQTNGSASPPHYGMLEQYDAKANTDVDTPAGSTPTQQPYEGLTLDREQENRQEGEEKGDNPPYNPDYLQYQETRQELFLFPSNGAQRMSEMSYQPTPCGLLKVTLGHVNPEGAFVSGTARIALNIFEGDMNGVHCVPMGLKL